MTELPIRPEIFWFWVSCAAVLLAMVLVHVALPRISDDHTSPFDGILEKMGLRDIPPIITVPAALLWGVLFLTLTYGLFTLIWEAVFFPTPDPNSPNKWEFRVTLAKLTALTATLGAVVALPFTVVRLTLNRRQTATAAESLLNTKIKEATDGLHAQRQVSEAATKADGTKEYLTVWQDDVIRRNAAIDALEGLVEENPDIAPRVARMLSVYVRELSREYPPKAVPEGLEGDALRDWAYALEPARSDMEKAVQTLGRLKTLPGVDAKEVPIDLSRANLQGMTLIGGNFTDAVMQETQLQGAHLMGAQLQGADFIEAQLQGADLDGAQLQGVKLIGVQLQGADFIEAQLQGAILGRAQLQGANLDGAQLQGADFIGAQLQGSNLDGASFDDATDLSAATLRGAALRSVDVTTLSQIKVHLQNVFGDGSVTLPDGWDRPTHWADEDWSEDWDTFGAKWRAWQRSIGMNPDGTERAPE